MQARRGGVQVRRLFTIHRVRNDLQRLAATLHLQIAATDDTTSAREALTDAVARIQALARVNGRLEQHWHSDSVLDSRAFLEGLGEDLREVTVGLRPITLRVKAEAHGIPIGRAIALGLIVNELVVNAVKYAFPEEQGGTVDVRFRREGDDCELSVTDDGSGSSPALCRTERASACAWHARWQPSSAGSFNSPPMAQMPAVERLG